jgi:DNA-binding transcriptional ArsR family regulator
MERLQITDSGTIRALSHPVRLAIINRLEKGRTATATELAGVVGLSPSATSYHLRALAKAGLIREAQGRGDGRERVWQGLADGFSYDSDNLTEDQREDDYVLLGAMIGWQEAQARQFYARLPRMPRDWADASTFLSTRIEVTAEEARDLTMRVRAMLDQYHHAKREVQPGTRTVTVVLRMLPEEDESADG